MCDIDGDIETQKGLQLECNVTIASSGAVNPTDESDKRNHFEIRSVYACAACSVADVLPLLAYDRQTLSRFANEDNFIALQEFENVSKAINESATEIDCVTSMVGVFLIKEDDHLVAVAGAEHRDQAPTILGVIGRVIPHYDREMQKQNLLLLNEETDEDNIDNKKNKSQQISNTKQIDLNRLVEQNGATLGAISIGGFLVVQPPDGSHELTLVLQHGYVAISGHANQIVWRRPAAAAADSQSDSQIKYCNEMQCSEVARSNSVAAAIPRYKESVINAQEEIFVANMGALIVIAPEFTEDRSVKKEKNENDFCEKISKKSQNSRRTWRLIGSHNAIVNFAAFKQCIATLSSARNERS